MGGTVSAAVVLSTGVAVAQPGTNPPDIDLDDKVSISAVTTSSLAGTTPSTLVAAAAVTVPDADDSLSSPFDEGADDVAGEQPLDADHDGLSDAEEASLGTNPNKADTDGDGVADGREVMELGTSPLLADTDGDGFSDGEEDAAGTDPLDPTDMPQPVDPTETPDETPDDPLTVDSPESEDTPPTPDEPESEDTPPTPDEPESEDTPPTPDEPESPDSVDSPDGDDTSD